MATLFENNHDAGGAVGDYWPNVSDSGTALTITAASGLNSTANGLQDDITKAGWSIWESSLTPPASNEIRTRWRFDTSNLTFPGTTPASNDYIYQLDMGGGGDTLIQIRVRWDSGDNPLLHVSKKWVSDGDADFDVFIDDIVITNVEHCLEMRMVRETADGNADGEVQIYLDSVEKYGTTNNTNFNSFANYKQYVHRGNQGTSSFSGDAYSDEFILDDDADASLGCTAVTNEFRFLGMQADSGSLYVTGKKDANLCIYTYSLDTLAETTGQSFGGATNAELDSRSRGVFPVVRPASDGVLYLRGRDGNNVRVQYNDTNSTAGWTDIGPGTATWGTDKYAAGLMPDVLNPDDVIVVFGDNDVYRTIVGTASWTKMGDATDGIKTAARYPVADNEVLLGGTAAGTIMYTHNFGVSFASGAPSGGTVAANIKLEAQPGQSEDDGEADNTNSTLDTSSNTIAIGDGGVFGVSDGYFRFPNITIPNASTINGATISLNPSASGANTNAYIIYGEDADNAGTISTYADYTGRTRTSGAGGSVNWTPPDPVTVDTRINSPDIATIIQKIVDRAGFASGNAVQIFVEDNGGAAANALSFDAWDGSPTLSATLSIVYADSRTVGTVEQITVSL